MKSGIEVAGFNVLELCKKQIFFWVKDSDGKGKMYSLNKLEYDNHLELASVLRMLAREIEIAGNK